MNATMTLVQQRLAEDRHLAVLVTTHPEGHAPQIAVVNAAVISHPFSGQPAVAFVARRGTKLVNLRRQPYATLVARAGWEWVAVAGPVELSGPDDTDHRFSGEAQRQLLRSIYIGAGGQHPDFDVYDKAMLEERRCAVLMNPTRIWTNPAGIEHLEPEETQ